MIFFLLKLEVIFSVPFVIILCKLFLLLYLLILVIQKTENSEAILTVAI